MKLSTIMKRGLAVGLMGIMMVSLAACGDNKEEEKTNAAMSAFEKFMKMEVKKND